MADKIENKPVAGKEQESSLSDYAFGLMKGAALGAAGGALGKEVGEAAARGIARGIARGAGGGTESGKSAEKVGEAAGAGAAAGGAGKVGKDHPKEDKAEINQGQKVGASAEQAFENEMRRQAKEVMDTPKDVMDHVQKRPVTAAVEVVLGGPAAVILDAKLRKWFGEK